MTRINGPLATVNYVFEAPLGPSDIEVKLQGDNLAALASYDWRIDQLYRQSLNELGIKYVSPLALSAGDADRTRRHMRSLSDWKDCYEGLVAASGITPAGTKEEQLAAISNPWSSERCVNLKRIQVQERRLTLEMGLVHFFATQLNRAALLPERQLDTACVFSTIEVEGDKLYMGTRGGRTYVGGKMVLAAGHVRPLHGKADPFENMHAELREETGMQPQDYDIKGVIGVFWDEALSRSTNLVFLVEALRSEQDLRKIWADNKHEDKREHTSIEFPLIQSLPQLICDQATVSDVRAVASAPYDSRRPLIPGTTGALLTYVAQHRTLQGELPMILHSLRPCYAVSH